MAIFIITQKFLDCIKLETKTNILKLRLLLEEQKERQLRDGVK